MSLKSPNSDVKTALNIIHSTFWKHESSRHLILFNIIQNSRTPYSENHTLPLIKSNCCSAHLCKLLNQIWKTEHFKVILTPSEKTCYLLTYLLAHSSFLRLEKATGWQVIKRTPCSCHSQSYSYARKNPCVDRMLKLTTAHSTDGDSRDGWWWGYFYEAGCFI